MNASDILRDAGLDVPEAVAKCEAYKPYTRGEVTRYQLVAVKPPFPFIADAALEALAREVVRVDLLRAVEATDAQTAREHIAELEATLAAEQAKRCGTCRWYVSTQSGEGFAGKYLGFGFKCSKKAEVDLYADGTSIEEVEVLSWYGSGNEYDFTPWPDFSCCEWEATP